MVASWVYSQQMLINKECEGINAYFKKNLAFGMVSCYGGQLVSINVVLTSVLMFMLLFFEVPKGVQEINYYKIQFFK